MNRYNASIGRIAIERPVNRRLQLVLCCPKNELRPTPPAAPAAPVYALTLWQEVLCYQHAYDCEVNRSSFRTNSVNIAFVAPSKEG